MVYGNVRGCLINVVMILLLLDIGDLLITIPELC